MEWNGVELLLLFFEVPVLFTKRVNVEMGWTGYLDTWIGLDGWTDGGRFVLLGDGMLFIGRFLPDGRRWVL